MRKPGILTITALLFLHAPITHAQESFVLEGIEMTGLLRISEGTVLNYLPLREGETIDNEDIQLSIRALFRAGFFEDIEVRRDGKTLIYVFEERPSIASFEVIGNKDIETPMLMQILRSEGLAEGRIFDESVLEGMKTELYRVYHERGKYSVHIDTEVKKLQNKLVEITIVISEGVLATIRDINVIGNHAFSDEILLEQMSLKETGFWSWTNDEDKYSRETLVGDIEKLRSYYLDRGYADFQVSDVVITLSEDRTDVFITLQLDEGEIYTVASSSLRGDLKDLKSTLENFIVLKDGETFSMQLAEGGAGLMTRVLEGQGFAFAEVEPIPDVNRENKTVKIVYQVTPGERTYVGSVIFTGAPKTNDEVFRREMRQFEGVWLSNALVERGKVRLERLPYVEKVESSTEPVPGSNDLVNVEYDIKERSAGNFLFGVGFGGSATGTLLNASVTHANFMGTGERVQVSAVSSSFSKQFSVSHTDPYATINGVSRTYSAFYREAESFGRGLEEFNTESFGVGIDHGWPINEYAQVGFGLNLSRNDLSTTLPGSSLLIERFLTDPDNGDIVRRPLSSSLDLVRMTYDEVEVSGSWSYDTRNRSIFATRGQQRTVGLAVATSPGDVSYYRGRFTQRDFFGLGGGYTLTTNVNLRFTDVYGDTSELPPGARYFAGGADTIRGFRESYLGPRDRTTYDSSGNVVHSGTNLPTGGKLSTFVQAELLLPNFGAEDPMTPPENTQFSLFADTGNLYSSFDEFDVEQFRVSAGVAATFLTPIGALRFSYGVPLRQAEGDRTERIQFTVGQIF